MHLLIYVQLCRTVEYYDTVEGKSVLAFEVLCLGGPGDATILDMELEQSKTDDAEQICFVDVCSNVIPCVIHLPVCSSICSPGASMNHGEIKWSPDYDNVYKRNRIVVQLRIQQYTNDYYRAMQVGIRFDDKDKQCLINGDKPVSHNIASPRDVQPAVYNAMNVPTLGFRPH